QPGPELDRTHRANLASLMLAQPESIDDLALALHAANLPRDRMRLRRLSRTDIMLRTLPDIRCPVFGIWGEEDVLYRGFQDRLAPALGRAAGVPWGERVPRGAHSVTFAGTRD